MALEGSKRGSKMDPQNGSFWTPPRAPGGPKPLKKWTKVRIQLEDLGSGGVPGPLPGAILAPPF